MVKQQAKSGYSWCPRVRTLAGAICGAMLVWNPAQAFEINTDIPDLKLNWDNTLKYSNGFRVKGQSEGLTSNINQNDGDRNFNKGLISNRVDLYSQADLTYQNFGIHVSGAAWYDSIYNEANDNPGGFVNKTSGPFNQFIGTTRTLDGRKAELLDAFVIGKFDLGGTPATVRVGRHTVIWGESLFLGNNAIGGAQNPVDIIKASSVPNSLLREITLPVPQISTQIQLNSAITLEAYYQYRFVADRFPGVGSYFSSGDSGPSGGQCSYIGPTCNVLDNPYMKPKNSGQYGLKLGFRVADTDFGLYAIRFHDKAFQYYPTIGIVQTGPGTFGAAPTSFNTAFQQDITAYGASFSHTFGPLNLAGEASIRQNMDLASPAAADISTLVGGHANNNSNNPAYAVGKTAHANLSSIWSLPRTSLWQEASVTAEIAWNRMLSCEKNCATALDPNGTRDAWTMRAVFEPSYRQIMPGLDISVPIGVGFTPASSRSLALGPTTVAGGGDMSIGVSGLYLDAWKFSASYTHYYGPEGVSLVTINGVSAFSYKQSLKDRDYVAFSLARTF